MLSSYRIIGCQVTKFTRSVPLPKWNELMNEADRTFTQQDTNMAAMKGK
jgi:hypothetical protein